MEGLGDLSHIVDNAVPFFAGLDTMKLSHGRLGQAAQAAVVASTANAAGTVMLGTANLSLAVSDVAVAVSRGGISAGGTRSQSSTQSQSTPSPPEHEVAPPPSATWPSKSTWGPVGMTSTVTGWIASNTTPCAPPVGPRRPAPPTPSGSRLQAAAASARLT